MPCPSEYLWSHVLNSATEGVRHLPKYHHIFIFFRSIKSISLLSPDSFDFNHNYRLFVNGLFTKAKICELHMASCVKEDVLRLQIAVDDPLKRLNRKHIQLFINSFWA